jgi:hypothetical protein
MIGLIGMGYTVKIMSQQFRKKAFGGVVDSAESDTNRNRAAELNILTLTGFLGMSRGK